MGDGKRILAIGGAVIKTAREELRKVILREKVEMLIHNGGSIFHDFQLATEELESHSHPIDDLLEDMSVNVPASKLVWKWLEDEKAPENSITDLCNFLKIPVLLFTGMACDFWQMVGEDDQWAALGECAFWDFKSLCERMRTPFHYVCMGSAAIQPEVFIKAVALSQPEDFRADVVDFLDMYRPRTRVAKFGKYYKMTHKEYLEKWLKK